MSVAIDAGSRYFGARLSENIARTPEGYLICRNTVIGRSGFQTYIVSEIEDPEGLLEGLSPSEQIEVYRDPREVFSVSTLASFNGKTFTIRHPEELLTPETEREHHAGHATNVRKGDEPLDSGDWPLVADIIVTDEEAIDAIERRRERELSCGYSYKLAKVGDRYEQRNIIGNHIALVEKARAGSEARINDSAPKKETPVSNEKKSFLKRIFGLGFKEFARDAEPEALADAMEELKKDAKDEKPEEKPEEKKAESKDEKPEDKAEEKKEAAKDAAAEERRGRLHGALDRMLNLSETKDMIGGKDADLEELKSLLGQFFTEEENEPEHEAGDEEVAPISQSDADKEESKEDKKEDKKEEKAADGEIVEPEPELKPEQVPESQFDSATHVLKTLRPLVARSKDSKLIGAFDTLARSVNAGRKKESEGQAEDGYAVFTGASLTKGKDAAASESIAQKRAREANEIYAKEMAKRCGRSAK